MKNKKRSVYLRSVAGAALISLGITFASGASPSIKSPEYISSENVSESAVYENAARVGTEESAAGARARKINYNLPGIPSRSLSYYNSKAVRYGTSTLTTRAPIINGIVYLSVREIAEKVAGARVTYNKNTKTVTVSASGLYLSATDAGFVIYANDRPLFSFSPTIVMSNGEVYAPASALEKALGIKRSADTSSEIRYTGSYKPLLSAKNYYREDEVYWLSKIISAESSGESLLGQIAVGDVILNRVKSPLFPNTIYSVIFDRKYGVQFSPTADGRIYASPTYTATLAAKICLEGISLSDDAMYFLNPRVAQSNWIVNNRPYVYTIGNHDFYR